MNTGTKIRTFFAAVAALVGSYYTYRGVLDDLLNQLGLGIVAIIIALCAVIGLIISEAAATYFNNDYTEEAAIGTAVTRTMKQDPEEILGDDIEDEEETDPFEEDEDDELEQEE